MTPRTPEYKAYHKRIVDILVAAQGEETRYQWEHLCDFSQEFADGETPQVVAVCQLAAARAME